MQSKARHKIFFTGENTKIGLVYDYTDYDKNCVEYTSLSMGFDFAVSESNYIRCPLWLLYYFDPLDSINTIKTKLDNFKKLYRKTKFCALISSHDKSGIRASIHNELSKVGVVDRAGKFMHNDDSLQNRYNDNKTEYLKQYKFNICPENISSPGYVTEKIFQSLYSGCVPVYSGWSNDPEPGIINPNIILWYKQDGDNAELIKEIALMNTDNQKYKSFMYQNYFCAEAADNIYNYLKEYTKRIRAIAETVL